MKAQPTKITNLQHFTSSVAAATITLFAALSCAITALAADGTWQSSSGAGDWTNSAKWDGGIVANGTDATALFNGTDGRIITNTGTTTIGNLTVDGLTNSAWNITGGTLVLDVSSGKPIIQNANNSMTDFLTISATLAGTNGFTLAATNASSTRLYLSGANTFTGGVNVSSGTLWLEDAAALNGNTVTLGNSTVATLGGVSQTYAGGFALAGNSTRITLGQSSTFTLSGGVSETGGARSVNYSTDGSDATVLLTSSSSYTGDTIIGATHIWGSIVLRAEVADALGSGTANVSFGSGTKDHDNDALELSDNVTISNKTLTLRGRGNAQAGSLNSVSGTNTWTGNIDIGTYSNVPTIGVVAGRLNVSGVISGSNTNGLAKVGDGVLALKGANTYTGGTLISAGTVLAELNQALANGNVTLGDGTGTDTLRLAGGVQLAVQDFSLTSSAHLAFDLTSGFTATQILVAGNQLGSGTYTVDIYNGGGFTNGTYTLMTVTGATNAAGFTLGTLPSGYEASTLSWNSNKLTLNAIPEPSVGLLLGLGGIAALLLRRKTRL